MNVESYMPSTAQANITNSPVKNSLFHFVFQVRRNRALLLTAFIGTIVQFIAFKLLYPFPDFISDSYSYIATNIYNMDVNLWPVGYSKFIWLIHQINSSDTFLVAVQYFIIQASFLYFFFSISYLYRPSTPIIIILFVFLSFNPMSLYISNCVLSDALFASLTITFATQFLWMLYRPTIGHVILQGAIIGLAFTIRYTAMYYPVVALLGMFLSRHRLAIKLLGASLGAALIIPFVLYTKEKTKEVTGTAEFSVFGGWQLANNALYMYNHITVDSSKLPPETRMLDHFSKQFFKKIPPKRDELDALPGTYFIKVPWAILKPYMAYQCTYNDPPSQFRAWGKVSPVYSQYGTYLIKHYPAAFLKYYLWLNTKNYFSPHLEKFGTYNMELTTVPPDVQDWFGYTTPDLHAVSPNFQGKLFYIYPILFSSLNILYSALILWLLVSGRLKKLNFQLKSTLLLISGLLVLNFAFSVFATPIVLRYQIAPMIILLTFSMLILDLPDNLNRSKQHKSKQ